MSGRRSTGVRPHLAIGDLFTSENLSNHWKTLDDFEGEAYERVPTKVKLTDGNAVDAYIYQLRLR